MLKQIKILVVFLALGVFGAAAQTNTFPSSGSVGIGTTSPAQSLEVNGNEQIDARSGATSYKVTSSYTDLVNDAPWYGIGESNLSLPDADDSATAVQVAGYYGIYFRTQSTQMVMTEHGNVGIGTVAPPSPLTVDNANVTSLVALKDGGSTIWNMGIGDTSGTYFSIGDGGSNTNRFVIQKTSGNVGIGTTSPTVPLEVDGSVKLTSGSGGSITYADGTTQSTAWTGTLTGGDYAESVDVTGDRTGYEPGDVLVVDPDHDGRFLKTSETYSLAVTGVYSTKPGVVGRRQKIAKELSTTEVPMAMVGIVPIKVSTENGPVRRGDPLVTSSTPGYAMKGTDRSLLAGAVIGKALGFVDSGEAVIEAVISLQ